jgi:hypothetical protein
VRGLENVQVEDVTAEIVVDDAPDRGRMTVLQVTWRRRDPLAVVMELVSRPEHPALPRGLWVAPRDLLRAGLDAPVGDGDVRIAPDVDRGVVRLDLNDGDRRTEVVLRAGLLRTFLDRTERVVPIGEERPGEELDAVLTDLLRA